MSGTASVPDSTSKNYLEQTQVLADYVANEVFKGQELPPMYEAAIEQFQNYFDHNFKNKTKEEIDALLSGSDWEKYAQELGDLGINQLTRQSPADALYDMLARYLKTGTKIFETVSTWTKRRASDGDLVYVGRFGAGGARVNGYRPGSSDSNLGVSLSRSH